MATHESGIVTKAHLRRIAAVYVRQSTDEQVVNNSGSTAYQRGLAEYAKTLGWPAERIACFEDLGLSGTAIGHRAGMLQLIHEIEKGAIGAVFASNLSRLSRDLGDFVDFLKRCERHDVLVVDNFRILNTKAHSDRFAASILAVAAEYENGERRSRMEQGRLAKLRDGKAVSPPPVGFDRDWKLIDDSHVRSRIRRVFDLALQERSALRVVRALVADGLDIPRQMPGRPIRWAPPTESAVLRILRNPAYMGDYVYGRRRSDPARGRNARGRLRSRSARPDETFTIQDHHEQYIRREEWNEIQYFLHANRWRGGGPRSGDGPALLSGLLRCGVHNFRLHPIYKRPLCNGGPNYGYGCLGRTHRGERSCGTVPGRQLDRLVREIFLERVSPPSVTDLRDAWRAARYSTEERRRDRLATIARLKAQGADLEDRLMHIRADHTLIFQSLSERAEDAKRQVVEAEARLAAESGCHNIFDETGFAELIDLAASADAIWNAETTTDRDRKMVIRTLIREIILVEKNKHLVRCRVEWTDGAIPTDAVFYRSGFAHHVIETRNASGSTANEIAAHLNAVGVRTKYDTAWTSLTVRRQLARALRARSTARGAGS